MPLECPLPFWYKGQAMTKTSKMPESRTTAEVLNKPATVVRNAETGQVVTVIGAGALAHSDFRMRRGVDLLKPIAEQTLDKRRDKRTAG